MRGSFKSEGAATPAVFFSFFLFAIARETRPKPTATANESDDSHSKLFWPFDD